MRTSPKVGFFASLTFYAMEHFKCFSNRAWLDCKLQHFNHNELSFDQGLARCFRIPGTLLFDISFCIALVFALYRFIFSPPPPPYLWSYSHTQVSPRNRINVAVDWLKVRFFGRDITRL